jgi:hypothetical protein
MYNGVDRLLLFCELAFWIVRKQFLDEYEQLLFYDLYDFSEVLY